MAATDRSPNRTDASAVAATCREAEFLRLLARADGDALAAAGTLACACEAVGTPYQVSVVRTRAELAARTGSVDDGILVIGADAPDADSIGADPSVRAYDVATKLGSGPDPAFALAGVVAGGGTPGRVGSHLLEAADLTRRPGLALPTDAPADAAYTTLAHATVSGEEAAARETLSGHAVSSREAASLFALAAVGTTDATERAATAIERALRPYACDRFETLGGYADVLSALAGIAPGLGVALGLGRDVREDALSAWREHGRRVHQGVRSAETARYDGLLVARVEGPVEPVARLLRDYRSPEPAVLAVSAGKAGVAALDPIGGTIETATDRVGGSGLERGRRGYARFDPAETEAFVDAFREER